MLPRKTIKNLKKLYVTICGCGAVPFVSSKSRERFLDSVSESDVRNFHAKAIYIATISHTIFIAIRLVQAVLSKNQKFFLLFVHFSWTLAFFMISWLHITLHLSQNDVKSYCNGLFQFFGSQQAMPGARFSAWERRRKQRKPCLIDILVLTFVVGAVVNTLISVQIFLLFSESYQYVYSSVPSCWKSSSSFIILPFIIYEAALPGINWTLLLFFIVIHLVHLFCTRDYLLMLRKNTQNGILSLPKLLHHYRFIQILHNHYNASVANYMPPELFVILSLTLAGNIGTIRIVHMGKNMSFVEMAILPLVSILTGVFQIIFYTRAGDLQHVSSFFKKSVRKGLYSNNKSAKMYLNSFPPLSVKAGNLLEIKKFTVVSFVGGVVVGTARLSVLFFNRQ